MTLIPFVQLEFAGQLGLPDGRYLSRDEEGERVLIVQTLAAPKHPSRLSRHTRPVDPGEEEVIPLTRATVAFAARFSGEREAESWLAETAAGTERRNAAIRSATLLLNSALNAVRAAARDPLVQEVGASRATAVRLGFGRGDELAEGRWSRARELAPPRRGRLDRIDPQTRVAAVLAGRERVHPAETLLERARLDIEQGRGAEARYGLRAAAAALGDDAEAAPPDLSERIAEAERRLRPDPGDA